MEKAHAPFSVSIETLDHWEKRNRRNNFFELVYIIEGKGEQCVNYNQIPYGQGSVFLLPASDCHTYTITEKTTFLFIRFTATYFSSDEDCVIDFGKWFCRLNFIIGNYNRLPGELVSDPTDKRHLVHLLHLLMTETERNDPHTRRIMQSSMVTVLELIARNVASVMSPQALYEEKKFADILLHIHYHLLDDEMVSPQYLAEKFHISTTYFSEYFKRNAHETYQEFILRSKLKLAEAKALYTDIPFKEIAYDLGFTDSSHLNKMMKRFYNKGMSAIRKSAIAAPLA